MPRLGLCRTMWGGRGSQHDRANLFGIILGAAPTWGTTIMTDIPGDNLRDLYHIAAIEEAPSTIPLRGPGT